jgi:hypothetical protein
MNGALGPPGEAVYAGEWRERVVAHYGVEPQIMWFETPIVVDNVTRQICSHQVLEVGTIDGRGAGDLAIAEGQHDRKAFAGAELAAGRDLIVDGSIVLTRSGRKWLRGSFAVASSSPRRASSAA